MSMDDIGLMVATTLVTVRAGLWAIALLVCGLTTADMIGGLV